MRLNEFIEMTSDLDPSFLLYFKVNNSANIQPIVSLKLTSSSGYFLTGINSPQTLNKFFNIIKNITKKKINLKVIFNNQNINIYGLQIDYQQNKIYIC